MARPTSFYSMGFRDYSNEPSTFRVPITTLPPSGFVAELTLIDTLEAAVNAVTMGGQQKEEIVAQVGVISAVLPTDPNAQREKKWLVRYHDAVTNSKFQSEIPIADLSHLAPMSDFMDTTDVVFTDLKAAWEAIVRSPDDNNLTVLDSLQFVGRRL